MSPRHPGAAADRHAETEARLRAALEARAELITPHDLAPAPPPAGRAWGTRRVRRAVLAAVGAVAASAALWLLLPGSPLRTHQAPPAYGPAATPTPPPAPSDAPHPSADPAAPTRARPSGSPRSTADPTPTPGRGRDADSDSGAGSDAGSDSARVRRDLDRRTGSGPGPDRTSPADGGTGRTDRAGQQRG